MRRPTPDSRPIARSVRTILIVRALLALATLAGMAFSARLWISSNRLFPETPIFRWLPQPPYPLDYVLFSATLGCLLLAALLPRPGLVLKILLALMALLCALDQSRWQPWFLQYAVMFGALLCVSWDRRKEWNDQHLVRALGPCRLFLMCMYFYSGIQKLGYGFAILLVAMVAPLAPSLHVNPASLSPQRLLPLALLLALVEAGSGILLGFRRTRPFAVGSLVLMHASIFFWLGPLGLNWNRIIWPWNLAMIAFLLLLFTGPAKWSFRTLWQSHPYAKAIAVVFGVLPVATLFGVWDSYLGFSLYSGNIKDAYVYIDPKKIADLPPGLRPHVKPDGLVDINAWSSVELGVPIYPETRIFASAGRQVAAWLGSRAVVRVVQLDKPDPFTGQRKGRSFDPLTY